MVSSREKRCVKIEAPDAGMRIAHACRETDRARRDNKRLPQGATSIIPTKGSSSWPINGCFAAYLSEWPLKQIGTAMLPKPKVRGSNPLAIS
jgi:hypothetical protein